MGGDAWRDASDHIEHILFELAFASGLRGCTQPKGIFGQAVPIEVMVQAAIEEHGGRRNRPGAVPDARLNINGRDYIYDVKRIQFCATRYWPTVRVASTKGGALEHRAKDIPTEYHRAAQVLDRRTDEFYRRQGAVRPEGMPTAVDILARPVSAWHRALRRALFDRT